MCRPVTTHCSHQNSGVLISTCPCRRRQAEKRRNLPPPPPSAHPRKKRTNLVVNNVVLITQSLTAWKCFICGLFVLVTKQRGVTPIGNRAMVSSTKNSSVKMPQKKETNMQISKQQTNKNNKNPSYSGLTHTFIFK